ncbi:hypothetical protein, partial [Enterobacter roggenkampii]|uniref:hypothetical protein n=1 Tax=Enterobacter roggenkampii TaxID=1812935 RepID=UPI00201A764B
PTIDTTLNKALVSKLFRAGVKNTTAPVGLLNPSQSRKGFPALFTVLNKIGYERSFNQLTPTDIAKSHRITVIQLLSRLWQAFHDTITRNHLNRHGFNRHLRVI